MSDVFAREERVDPTQLHTRPIYIAEVEWEGSTPLRTFLAAIEKHGLLLMAQEPVAPFHHDMSVTTLHSASRSQLVEFLKEHYEDMDDAKIDSCIHEVKPPAVN